MLDGFDVAVRPRGRSELDAFAELGATRAFTETEAGDPDVMQTASASPADVF